MSEKDGHGIQSKKVCQVLGRGDPLYLVLTGHSVGHIASFLILIPASRLLFLFLLLFFYLLSPLDHFLPSFGTACSKDRGERERRRMVKKGRKGSK